MDGAERSGGFNEASGDDLGANDFADAIETPFDLNRLEIRRLAHDLARVPARLFNQHVERAPNHFAIECPPLRVEDHLKPREPLRFYGFGDLILQRRGGPRARRVLERKRIREVGLFDQIQGCREVLFALARKAGDEIGGQGDVRPRAADFRDKREVDGARVAAVHRGEDFVGTGLNWQMQEGH
jgi:hypothetical protein